MKKLAMFFFAALALTSFATAQTMMKSATPNSSPAAMMAKRPLSGTELRLAVGSGNKSQFTDLATAQAIAAKGPTVLFFAADWCPTCKEALKDINADGSELKNVNVVVVDYDNSADLKKKYGVTYQHTFVQIDAMGKAISVWSGGGVAEILANVKKAL